MSTHVLYVAGEDNRLRIPFFLAMQALGFRVTAADSGDPAPFRAAGIEHVRFDFERFLRPSADLRALRALASLLGEQAPDIAQGYDSKPCLFLPLAAWLSGSRTRIVRTICGRAWVYSSTAPAALAGRPVYRTLHRLAARATAATVFEIDDDRRFFERHRMAGQRGIVIPAGGGGVDVRGFERALGLAPSRDEMRRALGLDDGAEVVITVTRMTRQKGIPALLRAAEIAHVARPSLRFVLVGPRESEGPLAVSEAEIARHAPYVIATGARSDVPALLRMADVFAFPTEYREGVARVLLEASLAGLPIVSTAMPGCCEVIRDGWNGLIVPVGDPGALARGILRLIEDRPAAAAMAARSAELTRERFSLDAIAAAHRRLYEAILLDRRSPALGPEPEPELVAGE
jgi:glycosyltransferase involved in cell wall biosynthesis